MRNKVDPLLEEQITTLITSMGYELVGCEMMPMGRQKVFRIYIDKENGVTLDDCSLVSRQVSAMLDVADAIQGKFTLEVSSPGLDRPIFSLAQFERFIGKEVKVKLSAAMAGRRQYKGKLLRVEEDHIYLLTEGGDEIRLPFSAIEKANLIGDIKLVPNRKKSGPHRTGSGDKKQKTRH
jgi:ribosome maturation factor RimP